MQSGRAARNPQEMIDRIAELMEEKRFNPSSFALALGFTRQWGYAFMKNQILISVTLLVEIAKVLGVTAASLLPTEGAKGTLEELIRRLAKDEIEKSKAKP